jgi:Cu-Zn family superoxide dismutase
MTTVRAVAVLKTQDVTGIIQFTQSIQGGPTRIMGIIRGLTDGEHGFHIHEYGDLSDGCNSAGAHFNPYGMNHGGPKSAVRHAGDYGNIRSYNGVAQFDFTDDQTSIIGKYSIIGRSLIVHADKDDLGLGGHPLSLTTGNSGARVACAVIGIAASKP